MDLEESQIGLNLDDAIEANKAELERLLAARKQRDAQARADALTPVLAAIKQHGFTAAELGLATAPKAKAEKIKSVAKVEPKYRDPASGAEWSGRGKTPGWLAAQIEAGKTKDDFLIKFTDEM